jgi:hypothetical protein
MIINKHDGLVVPNKTIAMFPIIPDEGLEPFNLKNVGLFLNPLNTNHKRDWFTSHFYKCLPLSIGNMQGFIFSLPYTFSVFWNGCNTTNDVLVEFYEDFSPYERKNFIYPTSEFGNGFVVSPKSDATDGKIELFILKPFSFWRTPGIIYRFFMRKSHNSQFAEVISFEKATINLSQKIAHYDGEPVSVKSELKVQVVPKSLHILIGKK